MFRNKNSKRHHRSEALASYRFQRGSRCCRVDLHSPSSPSTSPILVLSVSVFALSSLEFWICKPEVSGEIPAGITHGVRLSVSFLLSLSLSLSLSLALSGSLSLCLCFSLYLCVCLSLYPFLSPFSISESARLEFDPHSLEVSTAFGISQLNSHRS